MKIIEEQMSDYTSFTVYTYYFAPHLEKKPYVKLKCLKLHIYMYLLYVELNEEYPKHVVYIC